MLTLNGPLFWYSLYRVPFHFSFFSLFSFLFITHSLGAITMLLMMLIRKQSLNPPFELDIHFISRCHRFVNIYSLIESVEQCTHDKHASHISQQVIVAWTFYHSPTPFRSQVYWRNEHSYRIDVLLVITEILFIHLPSVLVLTIHQRLCSFRERTRDTLFHDVS